MSSTEQVHRTGIIADGRYQTLVHQSMWRCLSRGVSVGGGRLADVATSVFDTSTGAKLQANVHLLDTNTLKRSTITLEVRH